MLSSTYLDKSATLRCKAIPGHLSQISFSQFCDHDATLSFIYKVQNFHMLDIEIHLAHSSYSTLTLLHPATQNSAFSTSIVLYVQAQ